MTHHHQDTTSARLTITDLAIRKGLGYQVARERALRGEYGQVERVGGRLYVTPASESKRSSGRDG